MGFVRVTVLAVIPGLLVMAGVCQAGSSRQDEIAHHAELAQQYLAKHEPGKAIPELQAVVALDPKNVEARADLGVLLFFQGEFTKALPDLRAAVEMKPGLWKIQALLGIAERRTGDDHAGRADLEAVFPQIDEPKLKIDVGKDLIESYSASGDLDRAAGVVASLLKLESSDPNLLYTSYRIHTDMAVEALLGLALVGPDSGQTHQAMAHELQRDRDLPATIANFRRALALDPTLPGIHFELAEALHASDDQRLRAEAVEQYRLAVETAPGDAKAAARMGDIEVDQGNLEAGAGFYRRALKLQPNNAEASIGLAKVLSDKGDSAEALTLLEGVEAADPTNALAHFRLSIVYRKLNRQDDVKRELELYQRYKDEREKLRLVYQQMRLAVPESDREK